jgi:hypothetical protein
MNEEPVADIPRNGAIVLPSRAAKGKEILADYQGHRISRRLALDLH